MMTRAVTICGLVAGLGLGVGPIRSQVSAPEVVLLRNEVEAKRKELRDVENRLADVMSQTRTTDGELPPLPGGGSAPFERNSKPKPLAATQVVKPENDRLSALERKMDRLLELMEGLKRDVGNIRTDIDGVSRDIRTLKRTGRK